MPKILFANAFRCDVPARSYRVPRPSSNRSLNVTSNPSRSYAFVEFRSTRDAEDAYYEMYVFLLQNHTRKVNITASLGMVATSMEQDSASRWVLYMLSYGHSLTSLQWAKNPPSSVWRYDRRSPPRRDRERSRSPRRGGGRDRGERDRDRERERPRERERERDRDERDRDRDRDDKSRRSRSPERRRSPTPERRRDDRARTPPPLEDGKKDDDRAHTPPYEH